MIAMAKSAKRFRIISHLRTPSLVKRTMAPMASVNGIESEPETCLLSSNTMLNAPVLRAMVAESSSLSNSIMSLISAVKKASLPRQVVSPKALLRPSESVSQHMWPALV